MNKFVKFVSLTNSTGGKITLIANKIMVITNENNITNVHCAFERKIQAVDSYHDIATKIPNYFFNTKFNSVEMLINSKYVVGYGSIEALTNKPMLIYKEGVEFNERWSEDQHTHTGVLFHSGIVYLCDDKPEKIEKKMVDCFFKGG